MTQQVSLFDEADRSGALPSLGVPGSKSTLSKAQKLFNKLIDKIGSQRKLLQQWRDFVPIYQQRLATELVPLHERLREGRIAMVSLLDQAMDNKTLGKTHRAKVRDILLAQLTELLGEDQDAELVRLYDKYSEVSFADAQRDDMDFAEAMASRLFGVELDAEHRASSPEELVQRIVESMQAQQADTPPEEPPEQSQEESEGGGTGGDA